MPNGLDLSQYTDKELEAIVNQPDLSSYSDEELMKIAGEEPTPIKPQKPISLMQALNVLVPNLVKQSIGTYMREGEPAMKWFFAGMPKEAKAIEEATVADWGDIARMSPLMPFRKSPSFMGQLIPQTMGMITGAVTKPSTWLTTGLIPEVAKWAATTPVTRRFLQTQTPTLAKPLLKKYPVEPIYIKTPYGEVDITKPLPKEIKPTPFIHGQEFIKGQAKNVKVLSEGLDDALQTVYQDFYKTQGIGDVPTVPDIIINLLRKHNVPEQIINRITEQTAGLNNISKTQGALQILGKSVNDPIWAGAGKGAEYNPRIAARNAWADIKSYMREVARTVNPQATKLLEELDTLAHDKIYPTITKFQQITGMDIKPKTSTILDVFFGGRSGIGRATEQEYIKETPEAIKALGKYLNSKEFNQELDGLLKTAVTVVKSMKSFGARQTQKKLIGFGSTGGGIIWLISQLLRKKD